MKATRTHLISAQVMEERMDWNNFPGATLNAAYFTHASVCSRARLAEGLQRRTMGHLPRCLFT